MASEIAKQVQGLSGKLIAGVSEPALATVLLATLFIGTKLNPQLVSNGHQLLGKYDGLATKLVDVAISLSLAYGCVGLILCAVYGVLLLVTRVAQWHRPSIAFLLRSGEAAAHGFFWGWFFFLGSGFLSLSSTHQKWRTFLVPGAVGAGGLHALIFSLAWVALIPIAFLVFWGWGKKFGFKPPTEVEITNRTLPVELKDDPPTPGHPSFSRSDF